MPIVFVTGTDTGIGKTVLAALLVRYLRQRRVHALAMKPFCSGSRDDVDILWSAQDREIARERINPFHYSLPVAPLMAARRAQRSVSLREVLRRIRELAAACELLLVEGAGGLYVPLGEGYTVADVIRRLRCSVVLAARNRLGTVNHTLLTLGALKQIGIREATVALIDADEPDESSSANARLIQEFSGTAVMRLSYLGSGPVDPEHLDGSVKKVKKTLARILGTATFSTAFPKASSEKIK